MIDLNTYGYTEIEAIPDGLLPGRVKELQRERFTVVTKHGEVTAVLKGTFYHSAETGVDFPCVGDFVLVHYNESGYSLIVTVLPRRSKFSRANYSGHAAGYAKTIREQVVATNFDYVFILSSLNWDFNVSRIVRYLTQTRQSGGQPVVILTKADLVEDYNLALTEVTQSIPDVPVHAICSHTGVGQNELNPYLMPGKTVVFLGMSGVGKTSLLNSLMEQDVMKVQAIREDDSRGRHTTTHRQLFMLPSGTMVIDTPGMRELGLFHADDGIRASFNDVEEWFLQCRFKDCRHQNEPGCAVLAALADGSLPLERWNQYVAQRHENKYVQGKTKYPIDKRARNKRIATQSKQTKRKGGWKK
ncbi:ribosome small subunit-dependent GTPase A [Bacillus sp. FJAT-27445]|uniref:ribosome small subunit-dependent GTPase A n=1 Tax=Bacillus sp. FJAT-27445 TaxID=1679166 RepID=UPI000743D7F2|nr:ribosome small subunit-dependent GTPase A [Bacillus sp. FJAT-27445]